MTYLAIQQRLCSVILISLVMLISCDDKPDHVDFDCGMVDTEITELDHSVGSYISSDFNGNNSSNVEEAAIALYVDQFVIVTETETSCFEFTPIPQLIRKIEITSANGVSSGGVEFAAGENLNELFELHVKGNSFNISGFISAQNDDPLLFHSDEDEVVFQLLSKPDEVIDQSFVIELTFDDLKTENTTIPKFEVAN